MNPPAPQHDNGMNHIINSSNASSVELGNTTQQLHPFPSPYEKEQQQPHNDVSPQADNISNNQQHPQSDDGIIREPFVDDGKTPLMTIALRYPPLKKALPPWAIALGELGCSGCATCLIAAFCPCCMGGWNIASLDQEHQNDCQFYLKCIGTTIVYPFCCVCFSCRVQKTIAGRAWLPSIEVWACHCLFPCTPLMVGTENKAISLWKEAGYPKPNPRPFDDVIME